MQNRELFRWVFAASGLWLLVSPYFMYQSETAFSETIVGDAGLLMVSGLIALAIAAYGYMQPYLVRIYLGVSFGLALIAVPWIVGSTEVKTAWSAGVIGTIWVLIALYELYQHMPEKRA